MKNIKIKVLLQYPLLIFIDMLNTNSMITCTCSCAGFEILAFPCNQFGAQEPGGSEQILEFACTRYKAEFPIFDKVSE